MKEGKVTPIKIEMEGSASFAVILVFDVNAKLNENREQIQEEVSELVPRDFYLTFCGGHQ